MCGISVIVSLQGHHDERRSNATSIAPSSKEGVDITDNRSASFIAKELDASLDLIAHRGPDSRGQWISPDKRVGQEPCFPIAIVAWHVFLANEGFSSWARQTRNQRSDTGWCAAFSWCGRYSPCCRQWRALRPRSHSNRSNWENWLPLQRSQWLWDSHCVVQALRPFIPFSSSGRVCPLSLRFKDSLLHCSKR